MKTLTIDSFAWLLYSTTVLRGLAAGIILGAELTTLPLRRKLDLKAYAGYMRTFYQGVGVKIYAVTTGLVLLLSLVLAAWAAEGGDTAGQSSFIYLSFAFTLSGFLAAFGATPPMRKLWSTPDDNPVEVKKLLGRFTSWGAWSTISHVTAFILLTAAIAMAA